MATGERVVLDVFVSRDEATQLTAIGIVHDLLRNLSGKDLQTIMPQLVVLSTSSSASCRRAVCDVFMWIYDNYKNDR